MTSNFICTKVNELIDEYKTNNPFELIDYLKITLVNSNIAELKGYCLSVKGYPYIGVSFLLNEQDRRIVAAHELGHYILHLNETSLYRFEDENIYNSYDKTEYDANIFAANLLVSDGEVDELVRSENMDYFTMCRTLSLPPELLSFKLFSMVSRGYKYNLPMTPKSDFLKS